MSFYAARVAPEKTVFRPVLPSCSVPGMTEMHMAKISYSEQLRHPNWQRKRLEVLEYHDFTCLGCDSKEKTLHVHHKHYVKGRMAWEYELSNFEALCEDCHKERHDQKERLDAVIAQFPSEMYDWLADLLMGFGDEYIDAEQWPCTNQEIAQAGRLAWHLQGNAQTGECLEVFDAYMQLGPDGFIAALRSALMRDMGR